MQYNEIEYGKNILDNGLVSNNVKIDIIILSKYLYHIKKVKFKEHKSIVYDLCKRDIVDFNEVKHYKIIDECIKKGRDKKSYPIQINSIPIYYEYLKLIDSIDVANDYKKVLLSLIFDRILNKEKNLQKLYLFKDSEEYKNIQNNMNLCYYSNKKTNKIIFNSSRIGSTYKIQKVLKDLNDNNIIKDIGRSRVICNFLKNMDIPNFVYYNIQRKDFDKVGWVWDLYKGNKKVKVCEKCNCLLKPKSNRTKYCDKCAREIKNEQIAEIMRNKRSKLKNVIK